MLERRVTRGPEAHLCDVEHCRDIHPRPQWGPGPWQEEPDRLDFRWYGLDCFAHRNIHLGNWCGYVGVGRKHPAFGHRYDEVPLPVHGGLTFSSKCFGHLCHAGPGARWWFGFDCAHSQDLSPGLEANLRSIRESSPEFPDRPSGFMDVYRDLDYVVKEIKRLAQRLSRFTGHNLDRGAASWRGNARSEARGQARFFRSFERQSFVKKLQTRA